MHLPQNGLRSGTLGIAALVLALVAASCGTDPSDAARQEQPVPTSGAEAPASTSTTAPDDPLDVITLPDATGQFAPDMIIGCPSGPTFPFGALDTIRPLEGSGLDAVQAAAGEFLADAEGQFWPQDGWQILHETADTVLIAHYEPGSDAFSFMDFERDGSEWRWAGSQSGGGCLLEVPMAEGLNRVDWRLDSDSGAVTPDATRVEMIVTEVDCVSGQAVGDRLRGPQIVATPEAVYVSFAAVPPPGDAQTCPGNPEQAVTVDLPEPLGERPMVDGRAVGPDLAEWFS